MEGRLMANCLAGPTTFQFRERIRLGEVYFYRLLKPERATVMIARDDDKVWRVREVKGPKNAAVEFETVAAVVRMVAEGQGERRRS